MKEYRIITMYSKELEREKRIFIYLPKSYDLTDKVYPVLYMHDGQNLFDDRTAYMQRSWRLLDIYEEQPSLPEVIIVGIESDSIKRADELIPFKFTYRSGETAGGNANDYLDFIVNKVKPYLDDRFRTNKSADYTGIMGSSFGGVNSIYAALAYGEYFTRFGCISNALLFGEFFTKMKEMIPNLSLDKVKKLYMDVGTKETENIEFNEAYVDTNKELYQILKQKMDDSTLRFEIIKDAVHHETSWEKRFPEIIKYMFND
jgi:predicted alpha/beta superfamily hydrolase